MKKLEFPASMSGLSDAMDYLQVELKNMRFDRRTVQEALLLSEESILRLMDFADEDGEIHLSLRRESGLARITLSCPGSEMPPVEKVGIDLSNDAMGRGSDAAIRNMLLHSYGDKLGYSRRGEYNFIRIRAGMAEKAAAIRTGYSFLAALALGLLLQAILSPNATDALCRFLLTPIDDIFIKGLKLVAGPMVFFAIVTAIAQYSSFSDPGRVSIKVIVGYVFTSICAIILGVLFSRLLRPGEMGLMAHLASQEAVPVKTTMESLVEYFVNIVPPNIIDPFLNVDTLQIIFLALLCGVAMGRIGDYSASVRTAMDALNNLFSKVTELLAKSMPVIVFFTSISLMMQEGARVLISLAELFGSLVFGMAGVICFYLLLVLVVGRVSPLTFIKKYYPHMGESFILGSAVAALPKTIRLSQKKLGISPRVTGFSLPFGAMANMDGNCLYLTMSSLFLARLVGTDVRGEAVVLMGLSIFILSIGAPIAPGSLLLGLTVLLSQIGVSVKAVTILLGVNAAFEMMQAIANTMGDVVISLTVARSEGLLNKDTFYSK